MLMWQERGGGGEAKGDESSLDDVYVFGED